MVEADETDRGHTKTGGLASAQGISGTSSGEVTLELSLKGVSIAIKRTEVPGKENSTCFKKETHFEEEQKVVHINGM